MTTTKLFLLFELLAHLKNLLLKHGADFTQEMFL